MKKALLCFLAVFAIALSSRTAVAAEVGQQTRPHEELPSGQEKDSRKELEYRIKVNAAFLKAAAQILENNSDPAVNGYLKMAEAASKEGLNHYSIGEFSYALEDISESTQMAVYAVILSRNAKDHGVKEFMIQEEILLRERQEKDRKLKLIKKGADEVQAFIKAAERLLASSKNEQAGKALKEAKAAFESSKADLDAGNLDSSLDNLDRAYGLATRSVKDIKLSEGEVLTFPRKAFANEKEVLTYELKKNNSYISMAARVMGVGMESGRFDRAKEYREQALGAMERGNSKLAIEKLRASTDVLIKLIKSVD